MPETIQQFIDDRISEANDRFKGMTRRERAVMVAGDAIWQVTVGAITPEGGVYLHVGNTKGACHGCAMACLFMGLMDHKIIKPDDLQYVGECKLKNALKDVFDSEQWDKIERAFELYVYRPFLRPYRDRFLRIAANIIHNKGTFNTLSDPTDARFNAIVKKYGAAKSSLKRSA